MCLLLCTAPALHVNVSTDVTLLCHVSCATLTHFWCWDCSVTLSMDHYWSSQRRNHNHRKYILYLNTVIKKAEWNKLLWWSKHFHYPVSPARSDNWWKKNPKCMYFTEAVYLWLLIMLLLLWKICAEGSDHWSAWTIPLGSISLSHSRSKQIVSHV